MPNLKIVKREATQTELTPDGIPEFAVPKRRIYWLAERLASGLHRREDLSICAKAWGLSELTVKEYLRVASAIVEVCTRDAERLRDLCAVRLERLSADLDGVDPPSQIRALEILLKLTGFLKGGPDRPPRKRSEIEHDMIEAFRLDPRAHELLRRACEEPTEPLRALLAELAQATKAPIE